MKKTLFAVLILLVLFGAGLAQAAAVRVWPSEIKARVAAGDLSRQELTVENPSENVALVEVYPDSFSNWIKILPESFTLESRESRRVILEIESDKPGIFTTTISVKSSILSSRPFKASLGVKIPLEVSVFEKGKTMFLASVSNVLTGEISTEFLISVSMVNFVLILIVILLLWKKKKICSRFAKYPREW